MGGKIDHGMTGIQQLLCDTVGQKCFSHTGVTKEQQIFKGIVKSVHKAVTLNHGISRRLQGRQLRVVVDVICIIIIGKGVKILLFQNTLQVGLGVNQIDGCLFQTVAALLTDVAGILTVRAGVRRLKIIRRITGILQTFLLAGRERWI